MKKNTLIIAVIGMMAFLATSLLTNAQTPTTGDGGGGGGDGTTLPILAVPDQLPLSMDDLQARAWESVANIGEYGWASSTIHGNTNDHSQVSVPYSPADGFVNIDEIFRAIQAQRLQLSILYASDTVSFAVGLYDKNGENMFWGDSSGKINPPENGVSRNTLDVELNMSDNIWLPFDNAASFYIVERDQDGNPIRYYDSSEWDIQNGRIRLPAYFAEKHGEIVITLPDGTQVAYGLDNRGQRIVPTTVLLKAGKVSALGTRTFRDTYVYVEVSQEEFSRNINPLSRFDSNGENFRWFAAWIRDPQSDRVMEYASAVHIWPVGQLSSTTKPVEIDPQTHSVRIFLPPGSSGRYWAKFTFKSGWPYGNQFSPPYQGGM